MLEKLYSPEEVLATFPEGRRPSLRRLIAKAKEANCCCKLGRGIGFTEDQVRALWAYISQSPVNNVMSRRGPSHYRKSSTYEEVRALLTKEKRKK
jgi:hypothetical protein